MLSVCRRTGSTAPAAFGICFVFCLVPLLTAQTANFAARRDYYLGGFPQVVAVGDFNGDGILDFVSEEEDVCFGNGDGTFRAGPLGKEGTQIGIAVADFDGDGKLDVAWVDGVGSYVAVAFGNGDGTFAKPVLLPLNSSGSAVAVADVDGDGSPDIVVGTGGVGYPSAGGISVILNSGNRNFANPAVYLSPQVVYAVAIGDVNQDGLPDIVVSLQAGVTFLLGTGGGSFTQGSSLALAHPAGTVALADLNNDGMTDVVAAGGWLYYTPSVSVFLGIGGGAFGKPVNIPYPNGTFSVAVGDVNQDGYPDLVVADASSLEIALLLNKGNGTFKAGRSYTGAGEVHIVVAPLRKPGVLDIVAAGFGSGMISVLLNQGKGVYKDGLHLNYPSGTGQPATADFNGDGHPDVAITTGKGVSILLGTGKAVSPFQAGTSISLAAHQTITGDFNGDGKQDLAVALTNGEIAVLLGNGDGTFGSPVITSTGNTTGFYIFSGDFNGDKKLDLVTTANQILFGNGDGTFQPPRTLIPKNELPLGAFQWMAPADLNGDGKTDLAIVYGIGPYYFIVLMNEGNGVFSKPTLYQYNGTDSSVAQIAVADFNGDGHPDVVISSDGSDGGFFLFLGNGDGTFQSPTLPSGNLFIGFSGILTGDFNGDGKRDVVMSTGGNCGVALFPGNGDGTFQAPLYFGTGINTSFLIKGEFQGQPKGYKPDLVVASQGAIDILLNRTP